MFLLTNVVLAQNLTADISSTSVSDYINDFTSLDDEVSKLKETSKDVYYDVPVQVAKFKWRTKTFEIAKEVTKYSKAELLDEFSNKTIKTVKLDEFNSSVDMNDVPSGSYYLILTNDAGEVYSEKILIL